MNRAIELHYPMIQVLIKMSIELGVTSGLSSLQNRLFSELKMEKV